MLLRLLRLAAIATFVATSPLMAQVTTGTILGAVTDPAGAAVAGATVTVFEVDKGTVVTRQTDETGSFQFPFLVPGNYRVTVEQPGFKKAEQAGITLSVDQRARIDISLQVGNVTETVEVTAAAPLVQSSSAETGQVIEQRAVQELPLNGRNFAQLVYLAPGVTPGQAGENLSGASTFNPRAAANYNPLGQRANANGWLLDGIDNNEYTFNTVIVQPSLESVREFKVLTGSFSAEFGRGAGVVSVSTRSGSNELHGTAFWFLRNIVLDARSYFQTPQALPQKLPFRRNQMGAAISGPAIKNKLFFFGDFAGQRETRGLDYLNTVPTAEVRAGNFSNFRNASGVIPIFDPLTTRANPNGSGFIRDQFPGNIIPAGRIGQVSRNLAMLYPLPNTTGQFGGNFNNYQSAPNRTIDDNQYTVRVDFQKSERDSMFFRYAQQWFDLDAPQGQANCCLPTPSEAASRFQLGPYTAGIQYTRLRTFGGAFNWSRVWNPSLVGEFRAGFARTNPSTVQSDFGLNSSDSIGIRNINLTDNATGLPTININDFTGISGGPSFLPARPKQVNYQIDYNLYWTKGSHNLKMGYHVVRRDVSPFTNGDTRGNFNFNRAYTQSGNATAVSGGTGFATMLLGLVQSGTRGFLLGVPGLRAWENALFLQDDWKVNRRLTLNLGVRYEIFSPETEGYNRLTSFDLDKLMFVYAGENGASRALRNTDYNNFGPRFGFAFDMFGDSKTIVRGGFGISFFPEPVSASSMATQGVPHQFSEQYSFGDYLLDYSAVPRIEQPFGPLVPLKPQTTAEINARRPSIRGYNVENPAQYAETWSTTIQKQLGQQWMAEVGYVGSRGINLLTSMNYNEVRIGPGAVVDRRPIQALRDIANVTIFEPNNMSTYHGLTTKVQRNFANGFNLLGVYTYGKSLDFGGSVASGGGNTGGPNSITCLRCYRGPSGFDVKHRAVINGLYDLPWGKGRRFDIDNGFLDAIIGGWQVGGIATLTTGRPFNVSLQNGVNNGAPSWPNRIADGRLSDPDPFYWFDATAFVAPPANTSYGNVARGVLYSPGVINFDTSLVKTFRITERVNLNFRWEAFNLFNSPYFGAPNAAIGSPTVGRITSVVGDNRSMQFSMRLNF